MTDRFYVERKGVRPSEEVIDRKELDTLRRLARAGMTYEAAAREFRDRHAVMLDSEPTDYQRGWLAAIREFSDLVLAKERDQWP